MEKEINKVSFTQMKDGNFEDYQLLKKFEKPYLNLTANRIIDELKRQGESTLEGYRITRLDHGLQSATRAEADGVDIDWIIEHYCMILEMAWPHKIMISFPPRL